MTEERKHDAPLSDWEACGSMNALGHSCEDEDAAIWDWRRQECVARNSSDGKSLEAYQRRMVAHTNRARALVDQARNIVRTSQGKNEPSAGIGASQEDQDDTVNLLLHIAHDPVLLQHILCLFDLREILELEDLLSGVYDALHTQYQAAHDRLLSASSYTSDESSSSSSESKRQRGRTSRLRAADERLVASFGDDRQLYRIIFEHLDDRKGWLAAHGTSLERSILKGREPVETLLAGNKTIFVRSGSGSSRGRSSSSSSRKKTSRRGSGEGDRGAVSGFKRAPVIRSWEEDHPGRDWIPLDNDPIYGGGSALRGRAMSELKKSSSSSLTGHKRPRSAEPDSQRQQQQQGQGSSKRPRLLVTKSGDLVFGPSSPTRSTGTVRFPPGSTGMMSEVIGADWFKGAAAPAAPAAQTAAVVATPTPSFL